MSNKNNTPSNISRRDFLRTAARFGTGTLVLVSGGTVWRALDQDVFSPFDGPAFEPWESWKNQTLGGALALLPSAILASSPHNTQPWLFKVNEDQIQIFADLERNLGSFDPYLREMYIGLGCAIENILIAAPGFGYSAEVEYQSAELTSASSKAGIVAAATITLKKQSLDESPLFSEIPNRHTYRGEYFRERTIDDNLLDRFKEEARLEQVELVLFSTNEKRQLFDEVMMNATQRIVADNQMVQDSEAWFRFKAEDIQNYRDGVTIDSVGLPGPINIAAKILPPMSPEQGHEIWLNTTRDTHLASAPLTAMLLVADRYTADDNLRAGRAWQRLHLIASKAGLSMHPMNQPVEWADRIRVLDQLSSKAGAEYMEKLTTLTAGHEGQATFSFRMGWAKNEGVLSPRRGVEEVLIKA